MQRQVHLGLGGGCALAVFVLLPLQRLLLRVIEKIAAGVIDTVTLLRFFVIPECMELIVTGCVLLIPELLSGLHPAWDFDLIALFLLGLSFLLPSLHEYTAAMALVRYAPDHSAQTSPRRPCCGVFQRKLKCSAHSCCRYSTRWASRVGCAS